MSSPFKVASDSMHPLIKIDETLQISPDSSGLKTFDIVVFKRKSQLNVHYVWRNQKDRNQSIITRSLKDIYHDEEPVAYKEVVGVVTNFKIGPWSRFKIIFLCFLRRAL